ncbi:MAG: hypothetical protein LBP22_06885 [Deltaproteobacteria bacterium]|jgi:hypothetical protein|nr:hypothetical protein [Deltaproteobacteria bacterium]
MYSAEQMEFLKVRAGYIWWMTPDEALEFPNRLIAQIMDIGVASDVGKLESLFSRHQLAEVIRSAEIGQFQPKSWSFWHRRLGLVGPSDSMPEMPVRKCGINEFIPRHITDGMRLKNVK